MTAKNAEKSTSTKGDGTGLHLVMNTGSGFSITSAGADVLDGWAKQGDVIQPGSAVAEKLIQIADSSKGLKLNKELRRLHEKAGGDPLGGIEDRPPKKQLQLPASTAPIVPQAPTFADQMADQMKDFVARGQAFQKDVDAILGKPFPASKGSELIAMNFLDEHPNNPRKVFRGIPELAKSIKSTGGLLVPIIVRGVPHASNPGQPIGAYQIIAGARRYRALQLLRKEGVDWADKALCDVRQMTDAQVAEAMMAENDDRDSLLPLEQAQGYSNMLKQGFTPALIAEKLGVSLGTVHGRLKLLELGKRALHLLEIGTLPAALATPLGRYPVELQDDALTRMLEGDDRDTGEDSLWEYREGHAHSYSHEAQHKVLKAANCIAWLQEHFTKSLKSTPFDQKDEMIAVPAEIWPGRGAAGFATDDGDQVHAPACGGCPKNSRNMVKEIAGVDPHDSGKAGFCTGLPCYQAKWDATLAALRAKAKETGDLKVLTPSQSAKALSSGYRADAPYAKASEVVHEDPKKRTWAQLRADANKNLEDSEQIRKVIATTEDGKAEMVEKTEVLKVLAAQGEKWAKKEKRETAGHDYAAQNRREQAKRAMREGIAQSVMKQYVEHVRAKGATLPLMRLLVELADTYGSSEEEREIFGVKGQRELDAFIEKKATMNDLVAMLYLRIARDSIENAYNGFSDETERSAKELKIDLKKAEKEATAAAKVEGPEAE